MAYQLDHRSQGANAHASVPAWSTSASAVWSIEFEIEVFALSSTIALGGATYAARVAQITTAGTVTCQNSGGGTVLTSAAGAVTVGVNTIKVERTSGGLWQLTVNGVSVSTSSTAACAPMTYLANRVQNSYTNTNIAIRKVVTSGGAYSTSWDGTNAPSTGTTWTSSGGQVATLNSFTGAAGSWWVFYDAGGATTATISAGLPIPSASASITATAPVFTSDIAGGLPVPVAASSVTVSGPAIDAAVSAGLPVPVGASSITVSAPVFSVEISAGLPVPAASASLINAGTASTATIAGGLPTPIASAGISVYAPVFSAVVAGGIPIPAASAQISVPGVNSAQIDAGLPVPIAAAQISISGINLVSISAGLPIPSASAQADVTLPIYQSVISAGLPVPVAASYIVNGIRVITIDDDCIVSLPNESRFVALENESRFAALPAESRFVAL